MDDNNNSKIGRPFDVGIYDDDLLNEALAYQQLQSKPQATAATPKCECGGDKTYGIEANIHADWCPKYGSS
jgi:hypothetical protein